MFVDYGPRQLATIGSFMYPFSYFVSILFLQRIIGVFDFGILIIELFGNEYRIKYLFLKIK